MQPKYLVTGGVGFIGSHIVRALIDAGEAVRVLDDLSGQGRPESIVQRPGGERVELLVGDLCDPSVVSRAVQGIEAVFHLAAMISVPESVRDPLKAERVNTLGTLQLLEAARQAHVRRVVFSSSSAVYGSSSELPQSESMAPNPTSPYAVSKAAAEQYLGIYARLHGLETLSLRYFNVFGPGQDPRGPYAAAIPRFLSAAIAGRPLPIYGDGEQTRDFVFVSDVVEANLLGVGCSQRLSGEVINIASGTTTSINALVEHVRDLVGVPIVVEHHPHRPGDIRHSAASIDGARRLLGYEPKVPWQCGLLPTYDYLRQSLPSLALAP